MQKLFRVAAILFLVFLSISLGWLVGRRSLNEEVVSTIGISKPRPLDKYTIENLSRAKIVQGEIILGEVMGEEENFTSYRFTFAFNPDLQGNVLKKTTGQVHIPSAPEAKKFPIVVMLRGYIDQETYKTGDGTKKAAEVFAKNGFITIAPDFLGYADSDKEAGNIFEARFQTYVTVLSLLKSLSTIGQFNNQEVFLWGHSNGGQIALTILEVTGQAYPTTLWAPVSKPFPYSILYYTDEAEDRGKLIRRELAKFEELYDPNLYSIDIYLDKINAPLQIHQGSADDAVPSSWSEELVKQLEELETDVTYHKYAGADHNMRPSWNSVVNRDLVFFKKHTGN